MDSKSKEYTDKHLNLSNVVHNLKQENLMNRVGNWN